MSDFPGGQHFGRIFFTSTNGASLTGQTLWSSGAATSAGGTWPASNRALYIPFEVDTIVVAKQMAFTVVTQSGNYDIGIYSETGSRLVSTGSTAVPAAGIATANITDTTLTPGTYFMALNIDNTTASVNRASAIPAATLQACGVQQQAVGAVTLPDPATFANPATAYVPQLSVACTATL